jgi:small-conductance mechanosensitive channel
MDTATATVITALRRTLALILPPSSTRAVIGELSELDLLAATSIVLVTLLADLGIILFLKQRKLTPNRGITLRHLASTLRLPLCALVSFYGLYAASELLLQPFGSDPRDLTQPLRTVLLEVGSIAAVAWLLFRVSRSLELHAIDTAPNSRSPAVFVVPLLATTTRLIIVVVAFSAIVSFIGNPFRASAISQRLISIALIIAIACFLVRAVEIGQKTLLDRASGSAYDALRTRKITTQIHFISRALYTVIGVFAFAAILMLFQQVRHIGTSLLTSAGILGIVAGVAAQKPLANLFAGFQIALTQPVREEDVVVVEGEWGRIEEITLSYIVVRIWDDRRLILPLSYFLEKPFQNWTRTASTISGTIFVWVDYSFPVNAGRKFLKELIETHPLWDKRFWNLQVTDAGERTMSLRILVTAADSSKAWDLRCDVRERFIAFLQREHPTSLPRTRAEVHGQTGSCLTG